MFAKTLCVALLSVSLSAFMAQGAPTADEVALRAHFAPRAPQAKDDAKAATTSSKAVAAAASTTAGKGAAATTAAGKGAASSAAASSAAATDSASATSSAAAATNTSAPADNGDPQKSLTLDPSVIATGFANDGQDVPTAGQVPSLTSTNNFINFCATVPNLPITNGKQIATGSCNPAPMGIIPGRDKMTACKFTSPLNLDTIKSNTPFTIKMKIQGLETGNFVNANANYFSAPQVVNDAGIIKGHSHVVVQSMDSLTGTTPLNPTVFAFFKGLNGKADADGVLTADVTSGLPKGAYKLSSINTASNHQPVLVPVAQHGSLDDAIYFTVTDDGQPAAGDPAATGAANQTSTATATDAGAATSSQAGTGAGAGAATSSQAGASAPAKTAPAGSGTALPASTSAKAPVPTKKGGRRPPRGSRGGKGKA
jgi:hypothetical protein